MNEQQVRRKYDVACLEIDRLKKLSERRQEMIVNAGLRIHKLEKESANLKKIIDMRHMADQKEREILEKLAANLDEPKSKKTRTICADCGKPAGAIHNCPEQARANRKARR